MKLKEINCLIPHIPDYVQMDKARYELMTSYGYDLDRLVPLLASLVFQHPQLFGQFPSSLKLSEIMRVIDHEFIQEFEINWQECYHLNPNKIPQANVENNLLEIMACLNRVYFHTFMTIYAKCYDIAHALVIPNPQLTIGDLKMTATSTTLVIHVWSI